MKNKYLQVILLSLAVACIMIVPQIIKGQGMFSIASDFNWQQVPFAMSANEELKHQSALYSWVNDIGSSYIGTYSFYNLGSPFFLLSIIFPATWYPYLIGPFVILKLVIAALFAYIFLQRYIKNKNYAIAGALLYSFSGFQITNLLFHFQDVITLFPLLLIGLDKAMYDDKKGLFLIAVFLNSMTNYFMFIGQVVFLTIYFIIKLVTKEYKLTIKKFIQLVIESVLGVGLSAIILIPSLLFVLGNPRINGNWTIRGALIPTKEQLIELFRSMILGPEIMSERALFHEALFTSAELYLPFVGIILFVAYMLKKPKTWISILIFISFLFMSIPILNSSFTAFTTAYYARWFYMPILIMSLASSKAMEENVKIEYGYIASGLVLGLFTYLTLAYALAEQQVIYKLSYLLINILIVLFGYIGLCIVYKFKNKKKLFEVLMIVGIFITTALNGFAFFYKYNTAWRAKEHTYRYINNNLKFNYLKDGERTDSNSGVTTNIGYVLSIPTLRVFNTSLSGSAFDFYNSLGLERNVRTDIGETHPKIRDFLSTKYIITYKQDIQDMSLVEESKGFQVYKNNNFVGMGIPYKYYISNKKYNKLDNKTKEDILLYSVVLTEKQIHKYKNILEPLELSKIDELNENYNSYVKSLQGKTSNNFKYTSSGATFEISSDKERLIIISTPYDKGWTIKNNNKEIECEKVDNGLVGIKINKGINNIVMEYNPPGLSVGILLSFISLIGTGAYLLISKNKQVKK